MDWYEATKKCGKQQMLLNCAKTEEENNNFEAAFELYQQAAALGNGDAMVAIGNLYAVKNFRMKETYDFLEHVLKGIPLMPYNLTKKQELDFKTALEWYIKAAELDHPDGCFAAGAMLCEGKGCESNVESSRLIPVGSAVYRSPAFGWLGEEKNALVLKVDRTCVSQQIQEIAEEFGLLPKEYAAENAAFIVENGEKEYSVEFAVIENGKVHVLYRYTIDGPDEIHSSFEPELISLTIDKYDADTINKETNGVSEECEQQENASKSINCANHCRKNMRLKLIYGWVFIPVGILFSALYEGGGYINVFNYSIELASLTNTLAIVGFATYFYKYCTKSILHTSIFVISSFVFLIAIEQNYLTLVIFLLWSD